MALDTADFDTADDVALADKMNTGRKQIISELEKRIVGQKDVVELVLLTLFVGGNSLIVGVPGLAKTLLVANIVLADEINRTPPKTQSALLEAMQEHRVTIQGRTYDLAEPFFVFATQNPIELEGTYPLPEAQLDRFMFHIVIEHPPEDEEFNVVR